MRSAISGAARFLSLFCALACLLQGTAQAQGMDSLMSSARAALRRGVLTLGEVYRRLDAANPELAASRARTRAAEARIASARRPPDPQLQFGLMNRMLPGFGLADPLGMNQVQVMQMLPFPGKLRLAGRVAAGRAEAEDARADDMGWDVRSRAAMAYYDAYAMDRSLVVAQTTLRIVRDLAEIARTMYAVGEGRQADVLRAQVEIARMEEEITRMSVDRYAAVVRLNALMARPPESAIDSLLLPEFPVDLPPLDSLIAEAELRRPMVQAGEAELRAADAAVGLARREIWPDIQLGVQYGQRPMDEGTDHMISLMLGFNVPIFAGSRQLAMRREAEAMRLMAVAELDGVRAETRGRVARLHAAIQRANRLASLYRGTILPQSETAVASALAAYRVGGVDFMTLLDNQMTVNRYRQELYTLQSEQGQALAELEMLLGRELLDPDSVLRSAQ